MAIDLRSVSHVMSGDCRSHRVFVLRLLGLDWRGQSEDECVVSIMRQPRDSGLMVSVQDDFKYLPLELVKDPDIPDHP